MLRQKYRSGVEYVWQKTDIYGPSVIQTSIIQTGWYNRSLETQKLLAKAMQRLLLKEFFTTMGVGADNYAEVLKLSINLRNATSSGDREKSKQLLEKSIASSAHLIIEFEKFVETI